MKNIYAKTGFHLIEVMLCVAIIAILVALSIPIYTHHLAEAYRLEAAEMLAKMAVGMEKHHVMHGSYRGVTLVELGVSEHGEHYRLMVKDADAVSYVLVAEPVDGGERVEMRSD